VKKVYQKIYKIHILVCIHNNTSILSLPLPINDFLHPGGLASDQVLEVTVLCPRSSTGSLGQGG
jgi:hypothetical protein